MKLPSRRGVALIGVAAVAGATALVVIDSPAGAASADVVISQVYGGGGNSGATYTNDYIQLFNAGTTSVDVSTWSVQYASATGSSYQKTNLTGSIAPGATYLIQEAAGSGGTTPLPSPNVIGTIAMSGTAGKVALVTNQTALSCGTACHAASGVKDFVGFGATANDYEGTGPAPAPSNTTADIRASTVDTDDNAVDFNTGDPSPSGTPLPPDPGTPAKIHDIQGAAQKSPLVNKKVTDVTGIVTAVGSNQFYLQDPAPDADPATSEGVAVFTGSAPTVHVGDSLSVVGKVQEYLPGNSATNLTVTEITGPTITVVSTGNTVPAATLVGAGGRVPPAANIDDDGLTSFDPATDGIDFWESLEGMLVEYDDPQVVGPTDTGFGETPIVPAGSTVRTTRGGVIAQPTDFNPERVVMTDVLADYPAANVGDSYQGAVTGTISYDFGNFTFQPTATPTLVSGGTVKETTRRQALRELAVATFNVENLSPADAQAKFDALAQTIVTNLASPDLVALEEIQDNSGPTNNGVVASDQTLNLLLAAIKRAGGPTYQWRVINPTDGTDGGQPGGNIRQAFMFRTDRGLAFVDRPGGTATTPVSVVTTAGKPHLSASPGRIDPANTAWTSSRKPLAGEFTWQGKSVFVVANHFNSKGGDAPLFGSVQPPTFPSETQRHNQAGLVRGFVTQLQAVDPKANVIVLGDLNDFDFAQTTDILVGDGSLVDLPRTLPLNERYTYDYQGNSEVLDHILISTGLAVAQKLSCQCTKTYDYDVVHVNSEFSDQVSDHDPQVVRLLVNSFK